MKIISIISIIIIIITIIIIIIINQSSHSASVCHSAAVRHKLDICDV